MDRRNVMLALPGRSWNWGSVQAILTASNDHALAMTNNANGWDDFNALWCRALNAYESGEITHFAMLHDDVQPDPLWLDTLMTEAESTRAALVSVPVPIKDQRGLTSCGIGDTTVRFGAYRRYTVRELATMPETFTAAEIGYGADPGRYLLHNTGCWVADLRHECFHKTDDAGRLYAFFDFPTRIERDTDGAWFFNRESEDWFFSRRLHELGAKTCITRKVKLTHQGGIGYVNYGTWGNYFNGDEDTAFRWRQGEIQGG